MIELKIVILVLYTAFILLYVRTVTAGRTLARIRARRIGDINEEYFLQRHRRSAIGALVSIVLCIVLIEGLVSIERVFHKGERVQEIGDQLLYFHLFCAGVFLVTLYFAFRPYTGLKAPLVHRRFAYADLVSAVFVFPTGLSMLWLF